MTDVSRATALLLAAERAIGEGSRLLRQGRRTSAR